VVVFRAPVARGPGCSRIDMGNKNAFHARIHKVAFLIVFVLLVGYCILGAAMVIFGGTKYLHNRWENTYTESPQTYAAIHAAQTGRLYIPMSQPPYTPQAYTPLYYAIDAGLARIAHLDVDRFVLYARLLSYFAFLLCGVMVFLTTRIACAPTLFSVLAALMMLGQPAFLGWNVTPRPDMLCLLAMLISLFYVVRWEGSLWRGYGMAGVFAGIAFLIKQPGLAVAAAIFFVLILQKEFKKVAVLTACALAPVVLTLCILYWHRDPFFQQITYAGKSRWSLGDAAHFLLFNSASACLLVPFAIGALGFARAIRLDSKSKMIAVFALVNWLAGLSAMPQVGGNLNYLFPALAGCALLLPYAIQVMQSPARLSASMLVASLALLWASSLAYARDKSMMWYLDDSTDAPLTWLRPYRILSDVTTMNLHGREPVFLDPFGAHVLELTGKWDATPLLESLNRQDYDLILFLHGDNPHIVPSFRGVSYFGREEIRIMNEKYEVLCSNAKTLVLKPLGHEVAATPEMFDRLLKQPCGIAYRGQRADLKLAPNAQ
jgi:hypothetical protein